VLAKWMSRCPVSWYSRGMACLRGAPIVPRLGASGVGLPGHRRGLNEARKNAAGRNRWRYDVRWRFGSDGFERGYRDPIRLLVESRRRRLRVSPTRFRASRIRPSGLAVFDGERRRYAFQRHPQKSVKLHDPSCQKGAMVWGPRSGVQDVLHCLGGRKGQLLRRGDLDFLAVGRIAALALRRSLDLELSKSS
jgi:hypothetical protein